MPIETITKRAPGWQGHARFDDGTILHAAPAQSRPAADAQLKACLRGVTPWREHEVSLSRMHAALISAGDDMVSERPGVMWNSLMSPERPIQWGGEMLLGEAALRAAVQVELRAIVSAAHTLADAMIRVLPSLCADARAEAARNTPLWQECLHALEELGKIGVFSAAWLGMPELLSRDASGVGFTTSVHWFPAVDLDLIEPSAAEDVVDHYDGVTSKRVEALTERWLADPCYRERFHHGVALVAQAWLAAA